MESGAGRYLTWPALVVASVAAFLLLATNVRIQDFELNADQLSVPAFAEELLRNPRFDVTAWSFPAAPLVGDAILYLPLRALFGAPLPSILAFAVLHFALVVLGVVLLIRHALDDRARRSLAVLAAAVLILGFGFGATIDWRVFAWPFLPLAHSGALVAAIYAFLAYERAREKRSAGWEAAGALLSFVGALSDSLFVPIFPAPYLVVLLAGAEDRAARLRCLRFAAVQAAAPLLARWLLSFTPASDLGLPSPHLFVRIAALVEAYWKGGALVVLCSVLAVALTYGTIGAYLLCWWRRRSRALAAAFDRTVLFLALSGAANILAVATIWSGENLFNGKYAPAFQLFPPLVGALLLARGLCAATLPAAGGWLAGLAAAGAVLAGAAGAAAGIGTMLERRVAPNEAMQCLDEAGLRHGLGGYWEARQVTLASGWRHQVDPLFPGTTTPFIHGNNARSFQREM